MSKNLTVLTVTAFFTGIYQSMFQVVWQPYAISLGASIATLGQLNSLGGFGGLVPALVQPLGGWLSDQIGHKQFIAWASVIAMAALGLYFMAGQMAQWTLLIPAVVLMGVAALARPSRGALVAESSQAAQRGAAYSLVTLAAVLPGIFAPMLGAYIAQIAERKTVFLVGLGFEALSLFIIVRWLGESRVIAPPRITWGQIAGVFRRVIAPPRHLRIFYLCVAADSFAWGATFGVLYGVLSKAYGYTDAQLGALNSTFSVVTVLSQMPLGRLVDRYGAKPSLVLSEALGIPMMVVWLTQTDFQWFMASFALFGLVGATWGPAIMTYLAAQVPAGSRSEAIGQMSAFRGLISFPAPAVGGMLYEWGGLRAPVLLTLVGIIILMIVLAVGLPPEPASN